MKPPRYPPDHPDYGLELEEEMEPLISAVIDQAISAGWASKAIWPALGSLVRNLERAATENRRTEEAIAAAKTGLAKPE